MRNISRRVEKLEIKTQSMEKESNDRKAKLLELQKQAKDDSLRGLLLRLELEHGRPFTLADVVAMADGKQVRSQSLK